MQQTFLQAVMEAAGAATDVTVTLGGVGGAGQGQGAPAAAGTAGGSRGGAAVQPAGGAAAGAGASRSSKLPSDIPDRPLTAAEAKDAAEVGSIPMCCLSFPLTMEFSWVVHLLLHASLVHAYLLLHKLRVQCFSGAPPHELIARLQPGYQFM